MERFLKTRRWVAVATSIAHWEESWAPWIDRVCPSTLSWKRPDPLRAYIYGDPTDPLVILEVDHPRGKWLLNLEDTDIFGDSLSELEADLHDWGYDMFSDEDWSSFAEQAAHD